DMPDRRSGLGVEADQVRIESAHEEPVAKDRKTAVRHDGAVRGDARQRARVAPDGTSGAGVESGGVILRAGDKHQAVDHQRHGLVGSCAELVRPLSSERADVGRLYRIEAAEMSALVVASVRK